MPLGASRLYTLCKERLRLFVALGPDSACFQADGTLATYQDSFHLKCLLLQSNKKTNPKSLFGCIDGARRATSL
jgi:hypothetical protein